MQTHYFKEDSLDIEKISSLLKKGCVIAFPTETVYGLGALISKEEAIRDIYKLKRRSLNKPLPILVRNLEDIEDLAEDIPDELYLLAKHFWPGPLTVVLRRRKTIPLGFSCDNTIAIRIPASDSVLKILESVKVSLVSTSANISAFPSSQSFEEVKKDFDGKIAAIIDGGVCDLGSPSTLITLVDDIKILRKGHITKKQIEDVLKKSIL